MESGLFVGLDVGTTSLKAVAVDASGHVVGESAAPTPWRHRGAESDCDPLELAAVAREVLAAVIEDPRFPAAGRILGVGVTGMAETGVLLDAEGRVLGPALAWHDPRGEVDVIEQAIGSDAFHRHVGMRLNSKPSVAKILWLQRHVPGASDAVRHLCIAEWIVHSLGGAQVAELSLTSRTGLFDVVEKRPWQATLELTGDLLADRLVIAGDDCGRVAADLPAVYAGAVLTVCGMDHMSAAFAAGAAVSGALYDSMGTAEAFLRFEPARLTRDQFAALVDEDLAILWSVVPHHVCVLGATLTGLSLERVHLLLGLRDRAERRAVAQAALDVSREGSAIVVDGSSHTGLQVRGIADDASPALLWRAAVEDLLAHSFAQLQFMEQVVGPRHSAVIGGGWINDPMVAAVKRAQLGEYRVTDVAEAGAVGAAMFAAIAAGAMPRPSVDDPPRWPGT